MCGARQRPGRECSWRPLGGSWQIGSRPGADGFFGLEGLGSRKEPEGSRGNDTEPPEIRNHTEKYTETRTPRSPSNLPKSRRHVLQVSERVHTHSFGQNCAVLVLRLSGSECCSPEVDLKTRIARGRNLKALQQPRCICKAPTPVVVLKHQGRRLLDGQRPWVKTLLNFIGWFRVLCPSYRVVAEAAS